ncbi:hypothetical protein I302_100678 [Kwoniella bestiolae CBS 10118]|uniref:SH3 domain-containing protein n=1 Tax=Kwoniella bestiolae CBS 10118 TaxID=1296100 RepID=A0A1B9G5T6_9TREE|nr:hypothetical protein I302_04053 [Kwoniella bestiolae CBS 10118]OCF26370.1 hypothetical protein I302_04053 [Kwoniella bestiolae CBS 10118]
MSGQETAVKSGVEGDVKASETASHPPTTSDKPSAGPSSPPKSADSSTHLVQPTPSHSHSGIIDLTSPQSSPSKRGSSTPSLTSNRPAPASPASSRPPSTQFDSSIRDRSGSLSASSARRISASSASSSTAKNARSRSRASSKVRPKSMLGTNIILPESSTPTPSSTSEPKDKDKDTIPESNEQDPSVTTSVSASQIMNSSWGDQTESFQVILPEVIIRDFAYPPTDVRYKGQGVIEDEGNSSESNVFRWPWKGDSGVGEGESSSSGGWGGFGFLGGWRNRSKGTGTDTDRPTFEDDDDDPSDQDEDYGQEEEGEDQYYSSPTQSDSGSPSSYAYKILEPLSPSVEPRGYYRAAYPFQALSSSEMDLQEGDLVNLVGRGNGDPGWVIARKVNILEGKIVGVDEKVGLVPESYLERVEVIED